MAIEDSLQKALPVKEIYAWIIQHFPYFKTAPTGWKNSVRHNLSLNKCFQKVEKAAVSSQPSFASQLMINSLESSTQNLGKGSLWMVEPQYRPNLIQALTRSPFHPCSTWEKHAKNLVKTPSESPGSKVEKWLVMWMRRFFKFSNTVHSKAMDQDVFRTPSTFPSSLVG